MVESGGVSTTSGQTPQFIEVPMNCFFKYSDENYFKEKAGSEARSAAHPVKHGAALPFHRGSTRALPHRHPQWRCHPCAGWDTNRCHPGAAFKKRNDIIDKLCKTNGYKIFRTVPKDWRTLLMNLDYYKVV